MVSGMYTRRDVEWKTPFSGERLVRPLAFPLFSSPFPAPFLHLDLFFTSKGKKEKRKMVLIKVSNFSAFLATTNSPSSLMCWVHLLSMNFMPSLQRDQKIIFDLYRKFHSPLSPSPLFPFSSLFFFPCQSSN